MKTLSSNFNFIRAITIAIDNLISNPKASQNLLTDFENENFIKSIEDIIFCENLEDETLVAASSILVKIGRKNLIQKSLQEWESLIQKTMERVNNAEFAGFLLEIAEKFEFDINLESWLIKGSSAEQHFCMRMRLVRIHNRTCGLESRLWVKTVNSFFTNKR